MDSGIKKDIVAATLVVAASDSLHKERADYVCDGTDDHVEIQAAIDALPATGGEVFLLDGTYNIGAAIVLDSYQTLRGCGRNTILTTSAIDIDIISATGSSGNEKVGIVIDDLKTVGHWSDGKSPVMNYSGIHFTYVDHSKIFNTWNEENGESNICLENCDFNQVYGNTCRASAAEQGIYLSACTNNSIIGNTSEGNFFNGIYLNICDSNIVIGNICQGNHYSGIRLATSDNNSITGNICQGNSSNGIVLGGCDNNTVTSNTCVRNKTEGISVTTSNSNVISANTCVVNSQKRDHLYDNIHLDESDYNLIVSNICRAPTIGTTLTVGEPIAETEIAVTSTTGFEVGMGVVIDLGGGNEEYHTISAITAGAPGVIIIDAGLTNNQALGETIDVPQAQQGINIATGASIKNIVQGNDLHDAGKTANFNDNGTCTIVQDDNREINQTQVKHMVYMKNTSGGNLVVGDVASLKAIAAGTEFIAPVGVGEDQVWGMLAENINDDAWGYVQVKGGTTLLKATNAVGGNIAIGDFLCTEAAGTRARKAAAGNMAFAIALEICEAADVTIDALIIVPRKI